MDLYVTLQPDRLGQQLRDGAGRPLAPLHMVHVRRSFQALSSSRALEVAYPGNSAVVARGNPFVATVEDIEGCLLGRGRSEGEELALLLDVVGEDLRSRRASPSRARAKQGARSRRRRAGMGMSVSAGYGWTFRPSS